MHMTGTIQKFAITPTYNKGFVYAAQNKQNGKIYIGLTRTTLLKRISSHYHTALSSNSKSYFHNALLKYEKKDFEWVILYESQEIDNLKSKEREWICLLKTNETKFGYNLTNGGEHCIYTDVARKKISDKAIERNLNGANNPFYGKSHSEEQKLLWSKMRIGIVNNPGFTGHTAETKIRLSKIRKKLCEDPAHIEKMSSSKKNQKPVICNETQVTYKSIGEAARRLNINANSIKNQLHNRSCTAGGLTFSFL